ncbi:MAG: 30S ribosomal protein S21 [Gammaproteobacteria bacterium]|nr:30S ribosomal protein S21 [Gammaproteobacteria bacterium]
MPSIKVREGEALESAIRRLKRMVEKAGIPKESRLRSRFEKPAKKRQREIAAAKKRLKKKLQRSFGPKLIDRKR